MATRTNKPVLTYFITHLELNSIKSIYAVKALAYARALNMLTYLLSQANTRPKASAGQPKCPKQAVSS